MTSHYDHYGKLFNNYIHFIYTELPPFKQFYSNAG